MKDMGIVYGSAKQAVPLVVGTDTVYIHTDIREHTVTDPDTGETRIDYAYHEIQYELREYLQLMAEQLVFANTSMEALVGNRATPETVRMGQKLQAILDAVEMPPEPELPPKIGYKWQLIYNHADNTLVYEAVPDPDAQGTQDNPIPWEPGMTVTAYVWYTHDGKIYVCVCDGNPTDISDKDYFEPMD